VTPLVSRALPLRGRDVLFIFTSDMLISRRRIRCHQALPLRITPHATSSNVSWSLFNPCPPRAVLLRLHTRLDHGTFFSPGGFPDALICAIFSSDKAATARPKSPGFRLGSFRIFATSTFLSKSEATMK
jgi:hypothetical protein